MQPRKHRKLRILPIVLSVAMMLTMIPVTASASASVNALNEGVDPVKNANLSNLSISPGTLSPAFGADVTSYTVTVAENVSEVRITCTTTGNRASVTVNYMESEGGCTAALNLDAGPSTTIPLLVRSSDGTVEKTYTITVNRGSIAQSSDADLSALSISSGTLTPTFAADTTSYTATVGNDVQNITVTPTVHESNATVKVNGTVVTSGSASGNISLDVGSNSIAIEVTAQDSTTKTYTIAVTREAAAQSSDADLSALSISSGTLTPTFAADTTSYTVSFIAWIKELVYRDVEQGSNEIKFVKSWVLPSVLYVHNRAWCKVYQLGKMFLCPTFRFTSLFYRHTYGLEIKFSFVLVHFNITSISFYISGDKS